MVRRPEKYALTQVHANALDGFRSRQEKKWYDSFFKIEKRVVLCERSVKLDDFPLEVQQVFHHHHWRPFLEYRGTCNDELVRRFYATLVFTEEQMYEAYVRGIVVTFDARSLSGLMGIPYNEYLRGASFHKGPPFPDKHLMAIVLTGNPAAQWTTEGLLHSSFTERNLHLEIIIRRFIVSSRHSGVRPKRTSLICSLCRPHSQISLTNVICEYMSVASTDWNPNISLLYGVLVTRLCRAAQCPEFDTDIRQGLQSWVNIATRNRS